MAIITYNESVSVTTSDTTLTSPAKSGNVTLTALRANTDWITIYDAADNIVAEINAQNILSLGWVDLTSWYAVAASGTQTLIVRVQ